MTGTERDELADLVDAVIASRRNHPGNDLISGPDFNEYWDHHRAELASDMARADASSWLAGVRAQHDEMAEQIQTLKSQLRQEPRGDHEQPSD